MNAATRQPRTIDYQALAEFRYEIRRFLRVSEEAARAAGIEPQQHQLLLAVKGAPADQPATIAYLTERMQLQHHSVVGLVDRLEARGLARRRRDPADQRRTLVGVTAAGETVLHDLSMTHREELRSRAGRLVAAMGAIVQGGATRK